VRDPAVGSGAAGPACDLGFRIIVMFFTGVVNIVTEITPEWLCISCGVIVMGLHFVAKVVPHS